MCLRVVRVENPPSVQCAQIETWSGITFRHCEAIRASSCIQIIKYIVSIISQDKTIQDVTVAGSAAILSEGYGLTVPTSESIYPKDWKPNLL